MDHLIQLRIQTGVFIRQCFLSDFLVDTSILVSRHKSSDQKSENVHLLRHLIRPELQRSRSTLHDGIWIEPTEYAGFVVFRRL